MSEGAGWPAMEEAVSIAERIARVVRMAQDVAQLYSEAQSILRVRLIDDLCQIAQQKGG